MTKKLQQEIVENFKNTDLGFSRIRKNLNLETLSDSETKNYCKEIIKSTPLFDVMKTRKNYYIKSFEYNVILTLNSYTLTIITAKLIK